MPCLECEQLEKARDEAEIALRDARARLQERTGVLSKNEYQRLLQDVSAAQERSNSARVAFERHAQRHNGQSN